MWNHVKVSNAIALHLLEAKLVVMQKKRKLQRLSMSDEELQLFQIIISESTPLLE